MIQSRTQRHEQPVVSREIRPGTCPDHHRPARKRLDFSLELRKKAAMLEEYLESHPNREVALDRLLADIGQVEAQRAEHDAKCDNDPDGLG